MALADYLLAYPRFEGGRLVGVGWGPQPYAGYISLICEVFGCLPDEAERQDRQLVTEILEYRAAKMAVDKSKQEGGLDEYPELAKLIEEMQAAQTEAIEGDSA